MATILVIDDSPAICKALAVLFELQGYSVLLALSPEQAIRILCDHSVDIILQDMNFAKGEMSGAQGRQLFYALRADHPDIPLIIMTAWAAVDMVVELIKAGATDYIAKPWDDQRLLTTVNNTLKLKQLQDQERISARRAQERRESFAGKDVCGLVFASTAMEQVLQMAIQLAPSNASVLITGENGTGKEGVAQVLHANSLRRQKPFIKVNMGALPADLIESELFGAEAGAYTGASKMRIGRFEAADGGTLFLDEIGNLSLSGQIKLLRVLQTGEFERLGSSQTRKVDVRVLSATNANLPAAIQAGEFRQDLFYRINVVELHLPSLAARGDDILPLARHFLDGRKALSCDAERKLIAYHWPGNVRELQNVCQRALLLSEGEIIQVGDLQLHSAPGGTSDNFPGMPTNKNRMLDDIDQQTLEKVMHQHQGIISRAAKQLGITRQALYRRLEFYGIDKV